MFEHGHRLWAALTGFISLLTAILSFFWDDRKWVRALALGSLFIVVLQGILGGLTVLYKLPLWISVIHGTLAQVFLCLCLWLAFASSSYWLKISSKLKKDGHSNGAQGIFMTLWILVFMQLVLGAVMRHSGAGLAIPDFPLAFGALLPPFWETGIALNYSHRMMGFLIVISFIIFFALEKKGRMGPGIPLRLFYILGGLLTMQITLGAFTIWTYKNFVVSSLHVLNGAAILALCFSMGLLKFLHGKYST